MKVQFVVCLALAQLPLVGTLKFGIWAIARMSFWLFSYTEIYVYLKTSNIRHSLVGIVEALPVGAAPIASSFFD